MYKIDSMVMGPLRPFDDNLDNFFIPPCVAVVHISLMQLLFRKASVITTFLS